MLDVWEHHPVRQAGARFHDSAHGVRHASMLAHREHPSSPTHRRESRERVQSTYRAVVFRSGDRVRALAAQTPARFVAFDLLALGDEDLMARPFAQRRRLLEEALAGARAPIHLTPATADRQVAARWFTEFEGAGLVTGWDGHPWAWARQEEGARWRPDKDPADCTSAELEEPVSYDLSAVLAGGSR